MIHPSDHRLALTGMTAAMVLTVFAIFSAGSTTHGFVAYYGAARLLAAGQLGPMAYDDRWFGQFVQEITNSSVREIFSPNPPTMALMALPVAGLGPSAARAVWLAGSLTAFVVAIAALARHQDRRGAPIPVPVLLLMLLAPAVFTNLRIGQGYLLVFALFTLAVTSFARGRDGRGGAALGLLLGLKTSGTALVVVLLMQRRWRANLIAGAVAAGIALAVTPFIDATMWMQFPAVVRDFIQRPSGSVTAYQTTLSLARRLCIADPMWNPSPALSCEPVAFVVPNLLLGAALVATIALVLRSPRGEPSLAAGTTLSLLALPASAEVHFVLLAIPLALLKLRPLEFAAVAALMIVPLEITAERFTSGWWTLLAYPRLYAAWLLWAASVRDMVAGNRRPVSIDGRH